MAPDLLALSAQNHLQRMFLSLNQADHLHLVFLALVTLLTGLDPPLALHVPLLQFLPAVQDLLLIPTAHRAPELLAYLSLLSALVFLRE